MKHVSDELPKLSPADLADQVRVRAALKRQMAFALFAFSIVVLALFFANNLIPGGYSDWALIGLFVAVPLVFLFVLYRIQWAVLRTHQVRCPSCRTLLAATPRLLSSPTSFCPACGKRVLLPAQILKGHGSAT